jgi:hypothetical protein
MNRKKLLASVVGTTAIVVGVLVVVPLAALWGRVQPPLKIKLGGRTVETDRVIRPVQQIKQPAQPAQLPVNAIGGARFGEMTVETGGGQVFIKGFAEVFEAVNDHQYVWLLRVYDAKEKLIDEHHYIREAVALPAGESSASPEFKDTIDLEPGDYRIELSLYGVPRNFDFGSLKFGENMKTWASVQVSNFERVTVR